MLTTTYSIHIVRTFERLNKQNEILISFFVCK